MIEQTSLKNNLVIFDRASKQKDIHGILLKRFGHWHLEEKTLADLHDPYLLKDMDKAVARILEAQKNDEKVIIFGDYDVDGVTSTSLLMHFFSKLWLKVSYRLPHRVHDGYGLKDYFVDEVQKLWVTLIVTVDCGSKDAAIISHGKKIGVDIIVTDHHTVPKEISKDAIAVVNPHRHDCEYPYKGLAGAGVAFKLIQAIASEIYSEEEYKAYIGECIDICAIWTVADCMDITGENRIIVKEWLKRLKNSRSLGIRRLIDDHMDTDIDADIFWFTIGPRLNAAWRMDTPYKAVNLILNNSSTVNQTLIEIEKLNNLRKEHTKDFVEKALQAINKQDNLLIYASSDIEHGIIWIVAGRLTEQYYKPSIVMKEEGDILVWSCRSPDYFSIIELLEWFKDRFIGFGGHKQAAGFSIKKENYESFKKDILATINKKDFSHKKKKIQIDKVVELSQLWFWFLEKVNAFKPFWMGNTKPLFLVENLAYEKIEFLGKGRDHIKFTTKHGFKIFWFFMWDFYDEIKRSGWRVSIVFDIAEDNWMGKRNLMLKIVDIILL